MQFLSDAKGLVGHDLKYLGLEVDELTIQHDASIEGLKVSEIQLKMKGSFLVVALKQANGRVLRDHFKDHHMAPGDAMIVLGRSADLAKADKQQIHRTELL